MDGMHGGRRLCRSDGRSTSTSTRKLSANHAAIEEGSGSEDVETMGASGFRTKAQCFLNRSNIGRWPTLALVFLLFSPPGGLFVMSSFARVGQESELAEVRVGMSWVFLSIS